MLFNSSNRKLISTYGFVPMGLRIYFGHSGRKNRIAELHFHTVDRMFNLLHQICGGD
jgi:hypothetical protein